jgi:hypothetical protein
MAADSREVELRHRGKHMASVSAESRENETRPGREAKLARVSFGVGCKPSVAPVRWDTATGTDIDPSPPSRPAQAAAGHDTGRHPRPMF